MDKKAIKYLRFKTSNNKTLKKMAYFNLFFLIQSS